MLFGEKAKKLSPRAKLQGKIKLLFILKRVIQFNNKRMINANENIPLYHDMDLLLSLLNILLLQNLHGIDFGVVVFALDEDNLGIGSFADHRESIKVVKGKVVVHE